MRFIKKGDKILAMVFDGTFKEGTEPITDPALPLQIVNLKHPKGKILASHSHIPTTRETHRLSEALLILKGKVRVSIFDDKELVEKIELGPSQCAIMVEGGIGIEVLEDAEMMEFKNGPFVEDKELI